MERRKAQLPLERQTLELVLSRKDVHSSTILPTVLSGALEIPGDVAKVDDVDAPLKVTFYSYFCHGSDPLLPLLRLPVTAKGSWGFADTLFELRRKMIGVVVTNLRCHLLDRERRYRKQHFCRIYFQVDKERERRAAHVLVEETKALSHTHSCRFDIQLLLDVFEAAIPLKVLVQGLLRPGNPLTPAVFGVVP